ncbi:hypothetical protein AKJ48_00850 [candidate division MSBL1 archaeon SCGC-AAA261O19]|uniref:Uncharacterized protein n=1 Tax=candidate division MSBL1 archaeon SCGC-AAA261O19 TaxID=1698277 RepID=A0A133VET3_9EURY|nr:hypothetical protein AKJ48_00850 [candidate division MSBL1 archaeon SCGC-AAA261O19]
MSTVFNPSAKSISKRINLLLHNRGVLLHGIKKIESNKKKVLKVFQKLFSRRNFQCHVQEGKMNSFNPLFSDLQ